jgi:perosamine synthetase
MGYSTLKAGAYAAKPSKDVIQDPNFERHLMISPNYRLPELCAAAGLSQLEKVKEFVEMRKKVARAYLSVIKGHDWIKPQKTPEGYENSYFAFTVALDKNVIDFKTFRKIFIEEGGDPFYAAWKLTYDEPIMREKLTNISCPIAENLQPKLAQLKTNFGDEEKIQIQKEALRKTIERIEK